MANNYQVLSFDLPEHGDRIKEGTPCKVQYCIKNLADIMQYAKANWKHISLFANSLGAYFSLLAYPDEPVEKTWFLSPIVDMQRLIENMMGWFSVTEEELESKQTISTPMGQKLYWDYYSFVKTIRYPIGLFLLIFYMAAKTNYVKTTSYTNLPSSFPAGWRLSRDQLITSIQRNN